MLDDLSSGYSDAVMANKFVLGNMGDEASLDLVSTSGDFDMVIHFASFAQISESAKKSDILLPKQCIQHHHLVELRST